LRRDRVGLGFSVFIGVKIDGHANERALKFEEAINTMLEVIACHLVSGEADYFLEVVVPDLEHYQRSLVGKLLSMPIVREGRSNIAIQRSRQEHRCLSRIWHDMCVSCGSTSAGTIDRASAQLPTTTEVIAIANFTAGLGPHVKD